jgi:hypothetical protein
MKKLLNVRNRARALASTTFGTQRASVDTKNSKIEAMDLHTAYRLPLHRLSDTQLQLLLQKYDDNSGNGKQVKISENLLDVSKSMIFRYFLLVKTVIGKTNSILSLKRYFWKI